MAMSFRYSLAVQADPASKLGRLNGVLVVGEHDIDADAVAHAAQSLHVRCEVRRVAEGGETLEHHVVHGARRGTWGELRDDLLDDPESRGERVGLLARRARHENGDASVVAVVSHRRIEVDHHEVAALDAPVARTPGRVVRVRPRHDDGGRTDVGIEFARGAFAEAGDLHLGHPDADLRRDRPEDLVVDLGRAPHQRDLRRRLELTELDQKAVDRREGRQRQRLAEEREQIHRQQVVADQADAGRPLRDRPEQLRDELRGAMIGPHVLRPDHVPGRVEVEPAQNRRRRRVADVDHHLGRLLDDVDRLVPRQVGPVAGTVLVGEDDQRVESFLLHLLAKPGGASLVLGRGDRNDRKRMGHRCDLLVGGGQYAASRPGRKM